MIYSTTTGNVYIPRGILGVGGANITTSVAVNVRNIRRNISLHVDNNAGIWDADDNGGKGKWLISSNNTTGTRTVDIPHPLTTGNLSAGNATLTGLTVNGTANINGILSCRNVWSTREGATTLYPVVLTSTSKASVCGFLSTQATTAGVKQLHVAGFFGASNASAININASSSDRRLKRNIQLTTKSGLDLINKLDVVEFDWKDGGHWDFGIVAQDAGKIDKNIVPNIEEGEKEN